ncbi:MAG: KEOPS complex subunit Pcc1 [Methanomicrobiales archaeon]
MKSLKRVETEIEIEFDNFNDADIVLKSIKPEIISAPADRSKINAIIKGNKTLKIEIDAQDTPSLRASLNSYLRWIILSCEILKLKK